MSTETPDDGPTVLVVDDDEVLRRQLARTLSSRGLVAIQAASGAEAIAVARAEAPEFAVVDLKMPGMSGLDVVRELVAIDHNTRVVVLTGYGSIATAVDAMKLGAVNYLQKPATTAEIIQALGVGDAAESRAADARGPSLARAEWEYIQRVLADCGGNISEAARRLGLHRRSLQRKLHKYPPNK